MATILSLQNVTNVFDIPLTAIVAEKKMNYRTTMDDDTIEDLAGAIKREGQLTPVRVQKRPDGKFDLVYGFRRYAAFKRLAAEKPEVYTTIRAEVSDEETPVVVRKIANLAENLAREDLTTYDQAVAFLDLKNAEDMTGTRIANSIGKSVSYVNNLVRIIEGLDDSVLTRWRPSVIRISAMTRKERNFRISMRSARWIGSESSSQRPPRPNRTTSWKWRSDFATPTRTRMAMKGRVTDRAASAHRSGRPWSI